jgi:hypothetical protein
MRFFDSGTDLKYLQIVFAHRSMQFLRAGRYKFRFRHACICLESDAVQGMAVG